MATKKKPTTDVVEVKNDTVSHLGQDGKNDIVSFFVAHADDASLVAESLGVDFLQSLAERADQAASRMSLSQRHMLAAGLLLASVKAEAEHGQFEDLIEARGFQVRAAQRAMAYAQYIIAQPADERERLIGMPQGKVLALAGADPEVIEALAASGESIDELSVAQLRNRMRELEAEVVNKDAARQAAEAERDAATKKLEKHNPNRTDHVPMVFADVRAEFLALSQKVSMCLDSYRAAGVDLAGLGGVEGGQQWLEPTATAALAGLLSLQVQINGLASQFRSSFNLGGPELLNGIDPAFGLSPQELAEVGKAFEEFKAEHVYETAMRAWDREQERPRDKGRPRSKPEAPKGKKA